MLQLYVWLNNPEEAGTFALGSIAISALTTGFSSVMISFDMDVDVPHRKDQPKFYGYLPDGNGSRGRCFALMTLISMLSNLSRSLGCALLSTGSKRLLVVFVVGELTLYLAYKLLRGDFFGFFRLAGKLAIVWSFFQRVRPSEDRRGLHWLSSLSSSVSRRASELLVRSACCYRSYI